MLVRIFIVCYNEQVMLPLVVNHYKRVFNNPQIYIIDNQSTDNSVNIGKELGCEIITLDTGNKYEEYTLCQYRNTVWRNYLGGWIIVCDMDEFLLVTQRDLEEEEKLGTSILKVKGIQMVANSKYENLSDLDIYSVSKGYEDSRYDKNLVFYRNNIFEIGFSWGNHYINPTGKIVFSEREYRLYHFSKLGVDWLFSRNQIKFNRSKHDLDRYPDFFSNVYGVDKSVVENEIQEDLNKSKDVISLNEFYNANEL